MKKSKSGRATKTAGKPQKHPSAPRAALDAAVGLFQMGQWPQAKTAFESILRQYPEEPEALHWLGLTLFQLGDGEAALHLLRQAVALRPSHVETHFNLGIAQLRLSNPEEAATSFRAVLTLQPAHAQAHFSLGNALQKLGQLETAAASFRQAIALKPDWVEAHFNLGNALRDLGQLETAAGSYRQALALRPNWAQAHSNLGHVLLGLGKTEEAAASAQWAIALDIQIPEAHFNLGTALGRLKRSLEALASYRMAVILKPDWVEAHSDLGYALFRLGRFSEAVASYRRVTELTPDRADAHSTLGMALGYYGLAEKNPAALREATVCHRQALHLAPERPAFYCNLAGCLMQTGLDGFSEAIDLCQQAIGLDPKYLNAQQTLLFLRQYSPDLTPEAWRDALEDFARTCLPPRSIDPHANSVDPHRRLRIGYVSPDFRSHSCAWFIEPLLAAHNREHFEIFCYANVPHSDVTTARLETLADHWHDILELDDDARAALIRHHGIDILVDLAGHTSENVLPVFHRKPAPVQVTWLGFPGSTGLAAIDYRLSDPWLTPPDTAEYFRETVWNLDCPTHCYRPFQGAPAVGPLPFEQRGYITFGSFNNFSKINTEVVALWAQVLEAVPDSHLLLKSWYAKDPRIHQQLTDAFVAHDIASDRIECIGSIPDLSGHLDYYNRIDIALDTYPYNGATTTLEALWMGVPVVSLVGWRTASRYGLSFLQAIGLNELAVDNAGQFVQTARELAMDVPRLNQLRRDLRPRLERSSLRDEESFAQTVEAAYRMMWNRWCTKAC